MLLSSQADHRKRQAVSRSESFAMLRSAGLSAARVEANRNRIGPWSPAHDRSAASMRVRRRRRLVQMRGGSGFEKPAIDGDRNREVSGSERTVRKRDEQEPTRVDHAGMRRAGPLRNRLRCLLIPHAAHGSPAVLLLGQNEHECRQCASLSRVCAFQRRANRCSVCFLTHRRQ